MGRRRMTTFTAFGVATAVAKGLGSKMELDGDEIAMRRELTMDGDKAQGRPRDHQIGSGGTKVLKHRRPKGTYCRGVAVGNPDSALDAR